MKVLNAHQQNNIPEQAQWKSFWSSSSSWQLEYNSLSVHMQCILLDLTTINIQILPIIAVPFSVP